MKIYDLITILVLGFLRIFAFIWFAIFFPEEVRKGFKKFLKEGWK